MGNAESFSQPPPPQESPPPPPPQPPPAPAPPERPLRSILKSEPASEAEGSRRSVVFADQFSLDSPSSNCQPFLLGDSVTHFGAEVISTRPGRSGGDAADSGIVVRRKKRAPPPPPRRDSISDAPAPEGVEDIRKKMRLDLQQSRAEYERLRNLRAPLHRREDRGPGEDAKTTVPLPQPLRCLSFRSDIDKNEPCASAATAQLTKILTDFHIGIYDERSQRLSAARDPSWSCHSSDSGISNSLDEHSGYVVIEAAQPPPVRAPPPPMPPPPPPRRFAPQNRPRGDVTPTFRVPAPRESRSEAPHYCVSQEIRAESEVAPTFRVPLPRRSAQLMRSESDVVPVVRLPPSPGPYAAPPPPTASSEPLFAFGDPVAPRRPSRHSMNDSFRRVRSSFGRFFGSIGRGASLREKRRPVSVVFGDAAHDFYAQDRPLDAWTSVGSALDRTSEARRPSAHEALDDHLASVWHRVVRSSHEQLRASNPSLFGEDPGELRMTQAAEGHRSLRTFQPPPTARAEVSQARF